MCVNVRNDGMSNEGLSAMGEGKSFSLAIYGDRTSHQFKESGNFKTFTNLKSEAD